MRPGGLGPPSRQAQQLLAALPQHARERRVVAAVVDACDPGDGPVLAPRPGAGGARSWRAPAVLVLAVAGLTQWVFPWAYDGITTQQVGPSLVLVARNVLLVVLAALAARDVVRTGRVRAAGAAPVSAAAA